MTDGTVDDRIAALEHRLGTLEDVNAIRRLHFAYGYYIDKCLYDEAVELFSDSARAHFLNGIYVGRAGARRLYCDWFREHFTGGVNGPAYGFLLDHLMLQDIIDVAPDRRTAKARFRCFMQGGYHHSRDPIPNFPAANWEGGIYENGYVKEDGIWKIGDFHYNMLWQADYHKGWDRDEAHLLKLTKTYPEDPNGPDELVPDSPPVWPHTQVVPFHYPHPVTGRRWND
ncbi:MAG: nuclear transport factor 2 family protein [Sphingomonas sp.]